MVVVTTESRTGMTAAAAAARRGGVCVQCFPFPTLFEWPNKKRKKGRAQQCCSRGLGWAGSGWAGQKRMKLLLMTSGPKKPRAHTVWSPVACVETLAAMQGQTWQVVDSKSAMKLAGQGCPISRGLAPELCRNSRVQVSDLLSTAAASPWLTTFFAYCDRLYGVLASLSETVPQSAVQPLGGRYLVTLAPGAASKFGHEHCLFGLLTEPFTGARSAEHAAFMIQYKPHGSCTEHPRALHCIPLLVINTSTAAAPGIWTLRLGNQARVETSPVSLSHRISCLLVLHHVPLGQHSRF